MKQNQLKKKKIFIVIASCIIILLASTTTIFASDTVCATPTDEQYLELRKVEVKEVAGQNKQVIMELWGNNVEFKRI